MSDWKKITMADLEMLPVGYRLQIPIDYLDEYKHMNVMWYTHLFSCALDDIFGRFGMTEAYFRATGAGTFALESHVRFINEVRVGQTVTIRSRLIARSEKRFHMMHYMANEETRVLAATMESIGTHVDLRIRRSSPMPPDVAAAFDRLAVEHARLPWPAALCGAMHV